jgi:hypothetical protein
VLAALRKWSRHDNRPLNESTARSLEKILSHRGIIREARGAFERFVRFPVSIEHTRWLGNLMNEAEELLRIASGFGQIGHYQCEL